AVFYGRNDAIRIYDAGPAHATLVDNDARRIKEMQLIYPAHWRFVAADYADFLTAADLAAERYDQVVADQPLDIARPLAWDELPRLMRLAPELVVNYFAEMVEELGVGADD